MTARTEAGPLLKLDEVREKISELVARNAVPMVQQAIDAVREEGQYQAMKYLFEMVGLYPAVARDNSEAEESIARILLEKLGAADSLPNGTATKPTRPKGRTRLE
ncbi:MAG TPA: hypothetical protein VH596_10085 [Terriglobales bacterium]|jgi:hypothetical protein